MEKLNTDQKQKNILIVDSNKELVHDLKDYADHHDLKAKNGLNFVFAASSKEALKKIVEQKIDLIILEVILPVVNGYYLLNALKKENTKIPVIIYTRLKGP
ncbi:response regulator, partial [Candidatus Pacearchaeota archaeon]|nr:response regulator [Candidatus Pacearchaeota archaeon]